VKVVEQKLVILSLSCIMEKGWYDFFAYALLFDADFNVELSYIKM